MKKVILGLLVALCMISCGVSRKKIDRIQPGQTSEDVRRILGRPDYRGFDRTRSEWRYRVDDGMWLVFFENDRVVALDFVERGRYGYPEGASGAGVSIGVGTDFGGFGIHLPLPKFGGKKASWFRELSRQLDKGHPSDYLGLIEEAAKKHFFSAEEVAHLLGYAQSLSAKVGLLQRLVPRMLNLDNLDALYAALPDEESRRELQKIITEELSQRRSHLR
ncbi:MAG: DUF4476 domain-containing protein [Porphyromonas sp.]|nr:DUF4476 domain-containing protein [Porphyromonas sp.]